ncbi:hypothetical protein SK128_019494 [Halocaridina rubra]|uniref:Carboxypeptidase Q n=1 Tax=Halocaridina rubra TaxID=373956 RepID=A0AAN8WY26_HALRR
MKLEALIIVVYCIYHSNGVYIFNSKTQNSLLTNNTTKTTEEAMREKEGFDINESHRLWQSLINSATNKETTKCNLDPTLVDEIKSYQDVVNQIITFVTEGEYKGEAYKTLAKLVDTYGPRLTGSGMLEAAIDFMLNRSVEEGLENVHTEEVVVPHWERNNESAWMTLPRFHKLNMLGLGSSTGTPPEGIRAEVLVVKDFDDLEKKAALAKGKIVVYNPEFVSYGETVEYRTQGATKAAQVGAVASLIRTIGPFSINSPHTGVQFYGGNNSIPTACITVEDAAMLQRLQDGGETIEVHLKMGAVNYPKTTSRNTIAEVVGSDFPQETVIVPGHLDSWDVGQGAMDDGGGAMISWNAAVVLKKLGLQPKRTLRVILWTGEEQGIIGGQAYYNNHASEKDSFQLIMESDIGTFTPLGLAFSGNEEATCVIQEIMKLLGNINATQVVGPMDGGPDIGQWTQAGVPTGSLYNANDKYFWFHHSDGDTMSVEDPDTLDRCLALWTSVAYVAADISHRIPHTPTRD